MKKLKKIVKGTLIGIVVLFGIFMLIGFLLPGDIKVKGVEGKTDDVSISYDDYITDENYEPEEKDLLSQAVSALHSLDMHEWEEIDNYFHSHLVQETNLAKVYEVKKTDPDKIDSIEYIVKNKKFIPYLNDKKVEPINVDNENGVEWATYPYDVWIDFSFTITRVIKLDNGETKKDTFDVKGNFPPKWLPDINETHWALGSLLLRPAT